MGWRSLLAVLAGVICALAMLPAAAGAQAVPQIVFASDRDGSFDIWRMNPDGTGQVKVFVSPGAQEHSPAISPNGQQIAYITGGSAIGGEPDGLLMVMNTDGSNQTLLASAAMEPAWSPDGQKIAFGSIGHGERDGQIWTINPDGTGETPVALVGRNNEQPTWRLDSERIAFAAVLALGAPQNDGVWTVDPDGSNLVQVTQTEDGGDRGPDWAPDLTTIAFSRVGNIWKMNPDGTGQVQITNGPDAEPAWSPDSTQIAFFSTRDGNHEIYRMAPDGAAQTRLTTNAAADIDPDWGFVELVDPYLGYARPKGATPFHVALATAYRQCTAPDRTHGQPFAFQSCAGPQQTSNYLTVGTGDSNGLPARNDGYLRLDTVVGNPATPADEADVGMAFFIDDVFTKPGLADYTGDVHTSLMIRVTDRDNAGPAPTTGTLEIELHFDTPCTATADPQEGSACVLNTTWDALGVGLVKEGKRTIWELKQVEVQDGGSDGDGTSTGDNTVFARPGLFVP